METKKLLLPLFILVVPFSTEIKSEQKEEIVKYEEENSEEAESENIKKEEQQNIKSESVCYSSPTQISPVTGFYAGIDLGIDNFKNHFKKKTTTDQSTNTTESKNSEETEKKKSKSKTGFLGDIFTGYNFQIGRFFLGLEASIGLRTAKNTVESEESASKEKNEALVKKKYSFGIAPRLGCNITGGLYGYINGGSVLTNYKLSKNKTTTDNTKKAKKSTNKTSFFIGLGLEQSFGAIFVRGECSKVFKKTLLANQAGNKVTSDSYTFKLGGGYRF